jgi:hypothetical protein
VNKRYLLAFLFCSVLVFAIISCKKINESTTLGDDVIPGVDGLTTFDTTLSVEAYNDLFASTTDSIYMGRGEDHILGNILNDPFFGKTNAKIFIELKPQFYKWTFSGIVNPDSLYFDSVVMVLGWRGTYGDSTAMQRVRVYEMDQSNLFKIDSGYQIRQQYFTYSNLLGAKDFVPSTLKDSVKVFRDTTANQLRIRLNDNFGRRLLTGYDSTNAYGSDSAFKTYLRGFAIDADPSFGNALMTFGLVSEPNTKLAIYYRYTKNGKQDTTVSYFQFTGASAQHNFIDRNFTGSPLLAALGGTTPDNFVYLINSPGSYATLKIPGLRNLSNRLIHRAELLMEQVYDPSDKIFLPPEVMYLDVYDSSLSMFKTVPYDFNPANDNRFISFGIFGQSQIDGFGNPVRVWKFKLTRYAQNILTGKETLHNFRLFTHRFVTDRIKENPTTNIGAYLPYNVLLNSRYAIGRVRVGGGNHPTQKMRLRIVYSKI